MRLPKIRFSVRGMSVRGMMVIVLAAGIGLHVTTAAWRACRSDPHVHSAIMEQDGNPGKVMLIRSEPLRPAFLRRATGASRGEACFVGGNAQMEMCELSNPEIRLPGYPPDTYAASFTADEEKLLEKMSQEYWSRLSRDLRTR
jgi:hypothetical protein